MNLRALEPPPGHSQGHDDETSPEGSDGSSPQEDELLEPSGLYALGKSRATAELEEQAPPAQPSSDDEGPRVPNAESPVPKSAVLRRRGRHVLLFALQLATVLPIVVVQLFFAPTELARCLVAASPLAIIFLSRRTSSADALAGTAALLVALLDQLRPLAPAQQSLFWGVELHQVIPLCVIAWVLIRLRSAQKDLADLSRLDSLTGLLNRRGFETLAEKELGRAARYRRPVAFALIDLDHFKEINDRFGHAHGDDVLRAVASELANLRAFDLPVRLGGDEFGLLMPETDEASAQRVVNRLEQRLRERLGTDSPQISMSVGIATSGAPPRPLADLMVEADRRMYTHKQEEHAAHAGLRSEKARER